MIRVGLFIDTFFPMVDGVINVVDNYAKRLNDKEFEVIVFCPKTRVRKYKDEFNYKVQRCGSIRICFMDYDLPVPTLDRKFMKALKESKLDIVHVHSPITIGRVGIKYAKKHKIPAVITFHSQFKLDIERATKFKPLVKYILWRIIRVFNKADECFTMNGFSKNLLIEYGCTRPITLLGNATDLKLEKSIEEYKQIANDNFNLKNEKFIMLYVGRINNLKNLPFIIKSLALIPKDVEYKMIFAGDGGDRSALERLVVKLGLSEKVLFTGKILDRELLKSLYARADLFLIPSKYDTDAIVKIEASCFQKPSVAIEGTGAGAILTNNVNGFLIKEDTKEFADLLVKLINYPSIVQNVGKRAKKDIYVTWDEIVEEVKGHYKRVIEEYHKKDNNF